ncbi:unnamed protein product [Ectocarpus sp. 8 AP-2014]
MGVRFPAGDDAGHPVIGSVAAGAGRGDDQPLRDVDVQLTHPTEPSSSSSRHLTEGSWEMNLEAPPPETKEHAAESPLDAGGASETRSAGGEPPTTKGSTAVGPGGDGPEAGSLSRAATNSAAAKSRGSGSSTSGKQEGEDWAAAGRWPEGTDGDVAVQLESLSLDDQTPTTASSAAGMPSQVQGNRVSSADDSAAAGAVGNPVPAVGATSGSARGPATALSLMNSLDVLTSSSGTDSVPEGEGEGNGSSSSSGGGGCGGKSLEGQKPSAVAATPVLMTTTTTTTSSSKKKKKKKGRGGAAAAAAAAAVSKPASPKQESASKQAAGKTTMSLEGVSDDAETDPATGSGSGSSSGGFGTVSAPTTVVRLAGSPSPPLHRSGGAGAETGLRRLAPHGGRVKSS